MTTTAAPKKKPWYRSLFVQVLIGIAAGIATGILFPGFSDHLAPLGNGFIKLIKMLVSPLIFLVVVTGIAKVGEHGRARQDRREGAALVHRVHHVRAGAGTRGR